MDKATVVDKVPPPVETKSGKFVYYTRDSGDAGSTVYCRRLVDGPGTEQVLMDTEHLSTTRGYVLRSLLVSDDHDFIGCMAAQASESQAGKETSTLLVYSLTDNGDVKHVETLENVFNFVFGKGNVLFYTVLNEKLRAHKVCGHRIGQPQGKDTDVFVEEDNECFVDITRTKDKMFHIVNSSTLDSSEVHVFRSDCTGPETSGPAAVPPTGVQLLRRRQKGVEYYVDHYGDEFIILANSPPSGDFAEPVSNPLPFRLLHAPSANPTSENWRELLHMADGESIDDVEIFRDYIAINIKRRGRPAAIIHSRVSNSNSELPLPYGGSCAVRPEPNPQFESSAVRLCFSSPIHMDSVVEYDMATLTPRRSWEATPLHINPGDYAIRHEHVPSGSVQVPMTLIHHKAVSLSRAPPTLIRVYGAYGESLEPEFRLEDIPLLLRGWAVVLAHAAANWAESDLLSCARYLLDSGQAVPDRLALTGVSAGGLAAGAALNTSPELFRAATLHVPFVDPLSAMLDPDLPLTGVENAEWGNPAKNSKDFTAMRSYAPYDNIGPMCTSSKAPSILVTAGGQDQRVSAWQPAKWVARLRTTGGYSRKGSLDGNTTAKLLFMAHMDAGHFGTAMDSDGHIKAQALRNAFLINEITGV
ncbi:hypothetical protein GGF46_001347 [Coemansia sp. RSA 552]|nr:hypothetical protein GGF46_001347 [Coemansia sp. RSA 552]